MKFFKIAPIVFLAILSLTSSPRLPAHPSSPGQLQEGLIVTRHFTGIWDQVDQEAQGIALEVVEQVDGSRRSVAYWYTYGADRKSAWYLAIGDLLDNRIEFELFDSTDVGFLQDTMEGNESVHNIGSMTIVFDSCDSGLVTFETNHEEVGSGSFRIERLTSIMNTHCSGGISDDMHVDTLYGTQRMELMNAREGFNGSGHASYRDYPGYMEFEVEVEGLEDGDYQLYVGGRHIGPFEVQGGRGVMEFTSPAGDGLLLLNFDPRGMRIEIHDEAGPVLSSYDETFEIHGHGHQSDDDHHYGCGSHHGPGNGMHGGMADCVQDGDFLEINIDLDNTGAIPGASGEAEWEMNSHRVQFSVEIEGVPVGSYTLFVGGTQVGEIEAVEMHYGGVHGFIRFRDPEVYGMKPLDFEPRGQTIEVAQGNTVILEVEFPME